MKARVVATSTRAGQRVFSKIFGNLFRELRRNLIEASQSGRLAKADIGIGGIPLFDPDDFEDLMVSKTVNWLQAAYENQLVDNVSGLDFEIFAETRQKLLGDYIRGQEVILRDVAQNYTNDLVRRVGTLIDEGLGLGEIIDRIKDEYFQGIARNRSAALARDLAASAYERGRHEFWENAAPGVVKEKEWLPTRGGKHDRVQHNRIPDNGPVLLENNFHWQSPTVGATEAPYPSWHLLHISERYHCGCSYTIVLRDRDLDRARQRFREARNRA